MAWTRSWVAGFGPLRRWLEDPEVEESWVDEPGRAFVARRERSGLTTTILAPGEPADLVERMLRTSGRWIDVSTPFVDAMMPDGSRQQPRGRLAASATAGETAAAQQP